MRNESDISVFTWVQILLSKKLLIAKTTGVRVELTPNLGGNFGLERTHSPGAERQARSFERWPEGVYHSYFSIMNQGASGRVSEMGVAMEGKGGEDV